MTRLTSLSLIFLLSAGVAFAPASLLAEDSPSDAKQEPAQEEENPAKERKTATVTSKPLKIEVEVDGVFVARKMTPVALRPEEWSAFEIEEIVAHGARVREGEVLARFNAKKLNEAIADLELSQRLTELSIRRAENELPRLEKSLEMSLADATQSHERINDDYRRYKESDRDRQIESAKMSLKMSQMRLDYAKDELDQLEKMYEADDLTEETEELILKRTRQQYESSKYYHELAKIRHDELMSIYLPRQDEDNAEMIDRAELSLQRAKLSSQLDLNRARYELEQKKISRDKSLERHAKLVQDRGLMKLKSPADGIVYYGSCVDGKWSDMGSMHAKLKPKKSVTKGVVMMTIVDPAEMYLLGKIDEKHRASVATGQTAKIRPAADDSRALSGAVAGVSTIPVASGKFAIEIELGAGDRPDWLVPGMTGKVKITVYHKKDALLVDKKAVRSEDDDEDAKYVWEVEEEDGEIEIEKERVTVGKTKGDLIEILDGLDEGDVVSLEEEEEPTEDDEDEDDDEDDD